MPETRATPVLSDFAGIWQVNRVIDDRLSSQTGRFTGRASFAPAGDVLIYEETGQLTLGTSAPYAATRSYIWRSDGRLIHVDYADGRPFHGFDPAIPTADHHCPPDNYRVSYDFSRWPDWLATWQVTGPRKDYKMTSRYQR